MLTAIRSKIAAAIDWLIRDDPTAWQKSVRDVLLGALAVFSTAAAAVTLWFPNGLADAKALGVYLWLQIGVPVLWAVFGIARRELWPLVIRRLQTFVAWLVGA